MYGYTSQGALAEAVPVSGRGCPDLGTLPDVTVTELYKGGILQFTCPEGMRREGPQKLMCDGTNWDQEPPRCLCKFTGLSIVFRPLCLCRFGCPQFSSGRSVSACLSVPVGLSVFFPFCLSFGLFVLFRVFLCVIILGCPLSSLSVCHLGCPFSSLCFYLSAGLSVLFPVFNNNNYVHLSCAHQRPGRSHDTYYLKYNILYTCRA